MYSSIAQEQAAPVSSMPFTSKVCRDYKFCMMGDEFILWCMNVFLWCLTLMTKILLFCDATCHYLVVYCESIIW